jgi:hypothetical protein
MNYSSLEDVYGTPFGTRAPVDKAKPQTHDKPIDKNHSELVKSVTKSLPLDTTPETESFAVRPKPQLPEAPLDPSIRVAARENFKTSGVDLDGGDDKLSRILRLIEQNKTGYQPAATQDMLLYIATGVFFLFTFDTFVMLGKSMRGR